MGINPADNLTAPQAIETIRQLLKLSGSRGRDNNWLLNEIAKHVSKFTPLAELAARREPGPGPVPGDRAMAGTHNVTPSAGDRVSATAASDRGAEKKK
jgi:hypothetical protein